MNPAWNPTKFCEMSEVAAAAAAAAAVVVVVAAAAVGHTVPCRQALRMHVTWV